MSEHYMDLTRYLETATEENFLPLSFLAKMTDIRTVVRHITLKF